jgi:hypothetical protein
MHKLCIRINKKVVKAMKAGLVFLGVAAGAAAAAVSISMMYPDIYRRMVRDGRRAMKKGKRFARNMGM